jgi:hypothetical protein
MGKRRNKEPISPFDGFERHFLNTNASGLFITVEELIAIGEQFTLNVPHKGREIVIKNLLNDAQRQGVLPQVVMGISGIIKKRIAQYQVLGTHYEHARPIMQMMIQKARSTEMLLQKHLRGNPYE